MIIFILCDFIFLGDWIYYILFIWWMLFVYKLVGYYIILMILYYSIFCDDSMYMYNIWILKSINVILWVDFEYVLYILYNIDKIV